MDQPLHRTAATAVSLGDKVAFLAQPQAYAHPVDRVTLRETHMSCVFLAGERVYKLKKPVRFPYLDFSTLQRREAACRAELQLNRRLARDVYLDVLPLTAEPSGLAIDGKGPVVDWLVVMRRLDEAHTLEQAIISGAVKRRQLDRLVTVLVAFYHSTRRVMITPAVLLVTLQRSLIYDRTVLLDPNLRMPAGLVRHIDQVLRRFFTTQRDLFAARVTNRMIVDGHGDLRPEHIWLDDGPRIIDCLEFNPGLRAVDPLAEIAFLSLECERLGGPWVGDYIRQRMRHLLRDGTPDALFTFYRCHRAMLRARLAIAHLLEAEPRTPEKWPALAREYLRFAAADARKLEQSLRTPAGR